MPQHERVLPGDERGPVPLLTTEADASVRFVYEVLDTFHRGDCYGDLYWQTEDGYVSFSAFCSDTFWWGTADSAASGSSPRRRCASRCGSSPMTAVYDHGCAGIFTSREAAVAHAQHLQCTSDGHHTFRVEPFRLNDPIDIVGRGSAERGGRRHHKGGTVVVVEEPDAG